MCLVLEGGNTALIQYSRPSWRAACYICMSLGDWVVGGSDREVSGRRDD